MVQVIYQCWSVAYAQVFFLTKRRYMLVAVAYNYVLKVGHFFFFSVVVFAM